MSGSSSSTRAPSVRALAALTPWRGPDGLDELLVDPDVTEEEIDRHTTIFAEAVAALLE